MYLLGKRADLVNVSDIKRLIENKIPENKTLDYKRELKLGKDKEKKEFIFDISAMYNTEGGCIIFGIEELKDEKKQNTGIPSNLFDLKIENKDKVTQLIEDIIKGGTEPNINQIIINFIEIDNKDILIIGVPKSLDLPTMATLGGTNKFYKRRNSGKYPVDVYELNQMFMQNQVLKEKIEKFREERIKSVINNKYIPNLKTDYSFFVHIIPFSYLNNQIFDFSSIKNNSALSMKPINTSGWDHMFNIDGYASFATSQDRLKIEAYNQIFRNGIYEIYSSNLFYEDANNNQIFNGIYFMQEMIKLIKEGLIILDKLEIEPPLFISFSFINVINKYMLNHINGIYRPFQQNEIIFPFVQLTNYEEDIYKLLKPNFDILWQSFGYENSPKI